MTDRLPVTRDGMTRIRFGLSIPAYDLDKARRATYADDCNRVLDLASGHFDSAWIIDHLQAGDADLLEGFTTLTYMSALHPRLLFGHTVLCQSFRNPALLAKMAATLQLLSGGRYVLGIGAGWDEEEYRAYGYDFPPAGVRVEQLEEALRIITAMWTQEQATCEGKHYRVIGAHCEPRPGPPPPLLIGAFRPRMLRLAARYAHQWDVSSTGIKEYRRLVKEFEHACVAVGREPSTVRRSWSGGCACAPTQQQAEELAGDRYRVDDGDFSFVGTPAQVVGQMQRFIDLGVDYFILDCAGFPEFTTLRLLIDEVLPALNA